MSTNDLNTALLKDGYRTGQVPGLAEKASPRKEVLNHAYEYTIREDIVMAMEELELTDAQAQALWNLLSAGGCVPLFLKSWRPAIVDVIRDSIESRADDLQSQRGTANNTGSIPFSCLCENMGIWSSTELPTM